VVRRFVIGDLTNLSKYSQHDNCRVTDEWRPDLTDNPGHHNVPEGTVTAYICIICGYGVGNRWLHIPTNHTYKLDIFRVKVIKHSHPLMQLMWSNNIWSNYSPYLNTNGDFWIFNRFLGVFTKPRKANVSFLMSICSFVCPSLCLSVFLSACPSVHLPVCLSTCPHGTTRFPLDGCSWNFMFEDISKNLLRKLKFHSYLTRITGTLHEDLCTLMIVRRGTILRMRNISDLICRRNQSQIFCSRHVFRNLWFLWDNVEKYGTAREATFHNIIRSRKDAICISDN
jgi:hypothetical protein